MKVAIVLNTSWNIFNFRLGLVKSLLALGHDVVAIAPEDNYSTKLVDIGCQFYDLKMDSQGLNPYRDLLLFFELRKLYKTIKPDVVLHFTIKPNIYGSLAARTLGIPCINNVSGLGTVFLWTKILKLFATFLYRISFSHVDFVFFQNKHDKVLFEELVKLNDAKVGILPGSGINLSTFEPALNKKQSPFKFIMIARLIIDKGVHEYVEAARLLKNQGVDARFFLLGAPDYNHKRGISEITIDEWINDGNIEYLGITDEVNLVISKVDAVVLPSYREGTPRTLLEGGAMGKPLITTDVPGCNNVVSHNINGFLCQHKDALDLANKMKQLCEISDEKYEEMSLNSRKIVESKFDEKIVVQKYLNIIEQISQ